MSRSPGRTRCLPAVLLALFACAACAACAGGPPDPARYRLGPATTRWDVVGTDAVLEDVEAKYPALFGALWGPSFDAERDVLPLRIDLEHAPVTRQNYDALNALALTYFEINRRAEESRSDGLEYLAKSFQSAKLLGIPWRAYGEVDDPALRDAILDFFEDAASGRKTGALATAPRIERVVASLARKEQDPKRLARIEAIAALAASHAGGPWP